MCSSDFGPGKRAVLRDVADQKNRNVMLLRPEQQLRCNFAHLTDAARRHFEFFAEGRLNGINDHDFGLQSCSAAARIFSTDISA